MKWRMTNGSNHDEDWEAREREADADLAAGRYETFDSMDDLIASFDDSPEWSGRVYAKRTGFDWQTLTIQVFGVAWLIVGVIWALVVRFGALLVAIARANRDE